MRNKIFVLLLVVLVLIVVPARAAKFIYDIPVQNDQIEVRPDGRVFLVRYFEFRVGADSQDSGTEIWAGLPTSATRVTAVTDELGAPVSFQANSNNGEYVVIVRGFSIKPGSSKGFYIEAEIPSFLYPDNKNQGYMTLQYTPGWWSSAVAEQELAVILPAGVKETEVRTGQREWDAAAKTEDGRTVVYFRQKLAPNERLTVNIGFPATYLTTPQSPKTQEPQREYSWTLSTGFGWGFAISLAAVGAAVLAAIAALSGRGSYTAPLAAMEGVGINMDLDPLEAAVLLRTEPRKVLTLALFHLLRQNNIKVEYEQPLRLEPNSPMGLSGFRLCMYESLGEEGKFDDAKLLSCYKDLVQSVIDKTKPYCRKETEAYYRARIADNWERLREAEDAEKAFESFDDGLFWLILDKNFDEKIEGAISKEWQVFPQDYWLGRHFGAQYGAYNWLHYYSTFRNVGNQLWSNQDVYKETQAKLFTPIVVPRTSGGSRKGGGGGSRGPSCACACACVSCACACACAGGGGCT